MIRWGASAHGFGRLCCCRCCCCTVAGRRDHCEVGRGASRHTTGRRRCNSTFLQHIISTPLHTHFPRPVSQRCSRQTARWSSVTFSFSLRWCGVRDEQREPVDSPSQTVAADSATMDVEDVPPTLCLCYTLRYSMGCVERTLEQPTGATQPTQPAQRSFSMRLCWRLLTPGHGYAYPSTMTALRYHCTVCYAPPTRHEHEATGP